MADKLGMEGKLYYKVGGVGGGGAWVELTNVRDMTCTRTRGESDVTTRANNGYRATRGTLKEVTLEWGMIWDSEDAGFGAIETAYESGAPIGLRYLDAADGKGFEADFAITTFTVEQPLEEAQTVSVTAKVTRSDTPPAVVG